MRKLASYIFIFILLAGIFTPFYSVSAQEAPTPTPASTPNSATSGTLGSNEEGNKAGDKKDDLQIQPQGSCGFICWGILTSIQEVTYWILQIMSLFIWLAGSILDKVLSFTIIEFKDNIDRMQGIQVAWILVRDLMNLGFVFLLLYQGLRMILGRSNNAKNVIFGIVLASILINFSLFMTKVIIDASNVVTIGFYNAIVEGSQVTEISSTSNTETKGRELKEGLSGAYVNALGVNSFYSKDSLPPQTPNNQINLIIIMLAGSILFLMVSVIFLAMAIMFLIRYAVLIVLMMLSPLAVMGIAIPQIQSLQKKWWDALLGQSLFGPAYMIMTWIILTLISSQGFNPLANQNANWTKLFIGGEADSVGLIINFIVIIVLTIMSLTIAKQQADKGGVKMSQWTTKATTFAGGVALGGTAALGRNTVGKMAESISNREDFKGWASRSAIGKGMLKTTRGVASGSFDVRRSRAGEAVAKATGVDLGKGIPWNQKAGQGGYSKAQSERIRKETEFTKSLKPSDAKYDEAKLLDKEIKRKAKEAQQEIDKIKEKEFKPEGAIGTEKEKAEKDLEESQTKLKGLEEEKEKLEKEEREAVLEESKREIRRKIDLATDRIKKEEEVNQKLKEVFKVKNKVFEEAKATFDEQNNKEIAKLQKIVDQKAGNEAGLNEEFDKRKSNYADRVEEAGAISRYAKLILASGTGAVVGGMVGGPIGAAVGAGYGASTIGSDVVTKAERLRIANKIRNTTAEARELSKKEIKKLQRTLNNPDATPEERTEAAKKLGIDKPEDEDNE